MVCVYIICLIEQLSSVYKHDVNRFTFIRIKEKVGERKLCENGADRFI